MYPICYREARHMQKNIQPTRIGLDMPSSRREIEEDILEELCRFSQEENMLTFQNLSEQLNISEKELTYYIRQMKRHGYVELSPEGTQVCLTELGRIIGAECRYRHETFMQFLQYVGVENDTAREDACRIEHIVSEETVRQVCNFMNYGDTFERTLRCTDLSYRYEPGDYSFLMGIYYMEKMYPRRLAREGRCFSENIRLHVEEDKSWFELEPVGEDPGILWYQEHQKWIQAEVHEGRPVLPSVVFEFAIQRRDPIIEGTALVAFARDGERPSDWTYISGKEEKI